MVISIRDINAKCMSSTKWCVFQYSQVLKFYLWKFKELVYEFQVQNETETTTTFWYKKGP